MARDALVVGIDRYRNLRDLKAPSGDAEAIACFLEQQAEFTVWRSPEAIDPDSRSPIIGKTGEVSLRELENALVRLFKPESKQIPDTALFYFSGHGLRKNMGFSEGFLATGDVDPDRSVYGLSLRWLRELLRESPIRQQIIWLDCCHAGGFIDLSEGNPGESGHARDRCFLAASRDFEPAYEDLDSSYSLFTRVLLEGLADRSNFTNLDLSVYIDRRFRELPALQRPIFSNFGEPILLRQSNRPVTVEEPAIEGICPYKGLQYFDFNPEDPKYFYGREKVTDELLDRVRQDNFLAVLGDSGSGKSSVIRAGLLHQAREGRKLAGSRDWKIQILIPGEHPLQGLAMSFVDRSLAEIDRATELAKVESLLQQGADGLRQIIQTSDASLVVLFIDQFEEVFTLCRDDNERELFFACLLETLEKVSPKLLVIIAMRIDFFGRCFDRPYSGLGKKIQECLYTVTPMKREELQQAILKPAEKVNLQVEPELVDLMLKDIEGASGGLPLLEDTLNSYGEIRLTIR